MPSKRPKIKLDSKVIDYINHLRVNQGFQELSYIQQVILSGALHGQKYPELADAYNQPVSTLKQRGPVLFSWLSQAIPGLSKGNKSNFRFAYPEILALAEAHFSAEAPLQVSGLAPSASGGFYGRIQEIEKLGKLLQYSGAIVILSGMNGSGRRTLVSQFLKQAQKQLIGTQIVWVHPSHRDRDVMQQACALLKLAEQSFSDALIEGKYLFVLEDGDAFKDNPKNLDFLRSIQYSDSKAIVISSSPLSLSFATDFPVSGLPVEDAMLIAKEFELEGNWWKQVMESLGGNPGFIRQYLHLVKDSLGEHHKDLILRSTVQYGVVAPFLDGLLDSFSPEELELLQFIAQSDKALSFADILRQYPAEALKVKELFHRGLLEERICAQKGRSPKGGWKPVYMVPGVLKKYILSQK